MVITDFLKNEYQLESEKERVLSRRWSVNDSCGHGILCWGGCCRVPKERHAGSVWGWHIGSRNDHLWGTGRKSWSLQQRDYGAAQKIGRYASLWWGRRDSATAESSVLFSLARLPSKQHPGPSLRGLAKTKTIGHLRGLVLKWWVRPGCPGQSV